MIIPGIKNDITSDFIESQNLLKELGFYACNIHGFDWNYDKLTIKVGILDYHIYDDDVRNYVTKPHLSLTLRWDDNGLLGEEHSVLITQNWESIRQTIISSSITDLGIKSLNRSIKLYALLNNIDYKPSGDGFISCMALKLNPKLYLRKHEAKV